MVTYVSGHYLGRRISVGVHALMYDLTGRSPESRNRVIETVVNPEFDGFHADFALFVRSREALGAKQSAVLEYPAIIGLRDAGVFVMGNGIHTIDIADALFRYDFDEREEEYARELKGALEKHGVEPDGKTPRIATIAVMSEDSPFIDWAEFGIIYPVKDSTSGAVKVFSQDTSNDVFKGIATYTAKGPDVDPASGELMEFEDPHFGGPAPAQRLAEWEYARLEEFSVVAEQQGAIDTRVAVAAIVIENQDQHRIGVCNRHRVA